MSKEIVIVDDEELNCELLMEILKKSAICENYELKYFTSPEEAFSYCNHNKDIEVILLDINMPGMDGIDFLEKYNAENTNLIDRSAFIVISILEDRQVVQKAIELGVDDFFSKPFDSLIVLSRLKNVLEKKDLLRDVKDALEIKKILLRTLLHDISNPLTVLSLLENRLNDKDSARLSKPVKQITEILSSVRVLEALDSGKKVVPDEECDLINMIRSSIGSFEEAAGKKNITLDFKISLDESPKVISKASILKYQIIGNLISNAIKFSPENSSIDFDLKKEGNFYVLNITDHGIGIPQEILNDIFKWDAKTSRLGTNKEKGTGFGMPIVKKFIDDLNMKIEIMSPAPNSNDEMKGTSIDLFIPVS